MRVKINIKPDALAPGGVHNIAKVNAIKPKGDAKCIGEFGIVHDGRDYVATKVWPAKLEGGSPLLHDAEIILGRKIVCDQEGAELDLEELVNKPCQVVVEHKKTSGGRVIAVVTTVFEPIKAEAVAK